MRIAIAAGLLFIGQLFMPASIALAASFDCTRATTPFERAICDNADLSAADDRLALTYETALGGLSEPAREQMRGDQRRWLAFAQQACSPGARPLSSGAYSEAGLSCLIDVFSDRSRVLETSRIIDGYRYYPTSRYAALPDPYEAANPESYWPVARHEVSYPQLDGTVPFHAAFNDFVAEKSYALSDIPADSGDPGAVDETSDTYVSMGVSDTSTGRRITLDVTTYWYGHGAAHGNGMTFFLHWLSDEEREVVATDIFDKPGWEGALLKKVTAALRAQHGSFLMLDDPQDIAEVVINPERWDLSDPYDLVVTFGPYEVAAYAYGSPTARIAWDDLAELTADGADGVRYGY
ncbi:MAG: DUF1311 domain-containing protein [Devosia sp.]|uniref:DUF3298 domain-containing protein n=1 Tax=Devosia sp. TaxID=1871048 RepID=UPI0024C790EB|nr:DUF3298 domain-containing protein [Devosia sp.]UYN98330.1 MAG: DUF1311 domain-containing protein [Devosia sp.]